jgi:hypothetical protein
MGGYRCSAPCRRSGRHVTTKEWVPVGWWTVVGIGDGSHRKMVGCDMNHPLDMFYMCKMWTSAAFYRKTCCMKLLCLYSLLFGNCGWGHGLSKYLHTIVTMRKFKDIYLAALQEVHADKALVRAASCLAFLMSEVVGEIARTEGR